ncbi:hypothetical protein V8C44DRAFT_38058 [Trichoderma aethiopicum]
MAHALAFIGLVNSMQYLLGSRPYSAVAGVQVCGFKSLRMKLYVAIVAKHSRHEAVSGRQCTTLSHGGHHQPGPPF